MGDVRLAQFNGYIFIVRTAITPSQMRTIKESFGLLAPVAATATRIFYEELFRLAPETRALFPEDMTQQHDKFVQMLSTVVDGLDNVAAITAHVADLGRRHKAYDVKPEHYAIVGSALLAMLRRLLGPNYTRDIAEAWAAAYDMLARVMQEYADTPHPTQAFFGRSVQSAVTAEYGISVGAEIAPKKDKTAAGDRFPQPDRIVALSPDRAAGNEPRLAKKSNSRKLP